MSLRFNPFTGNLDFDSKPEPVDSNNTRVEKDFNAAEDISALQMVIAINPTSVAVADKELLNDAQAFGMAITAGLTGTEIRVVTFGQIDDPSFNFGANEQLFLNNNGAITDIPPITGHNVPVGRGMGVGSIFIDIDELTIL